MRKEEAVRRYQHGLKIGSLFIEYNRSKLDNTQRYLQKDFHNQNFLNYLFHESFFPISYFAARIHQPYERKATEDPYFKHPLSTAYRCFENPIFAQYNSEDQPIFITAALLHDYVELMRKTEPTYKEKEFYELIISNIRRRRSTLNKSSAKLIITICSLLTPEVKLVDTTFMQWRALKHKDFVRIVDLNYVDFNSKYLQLFPHAIEIFTLEELEIYTDMVKQIKFADDAAILNETVDDVENNHDGKDNGHNGIRPLVDRVAVYEERLNIIAANYPEHFLIQSMRKDINYLKTKL